MKRIIILILVLLGSLTMFSQDRSYFDAPFALGGGYVVILAKPDFTNLDTKLKSIGYPQFGKKWIFTHGGGGFVYPGFVPGLRIGGMGYGGKTTVSEGNKEVSFSMGGGGATIEYTLPFVKAIAISPGLIIGGGGLQISMFENDGSYNWDQISQIDDPSFNREITSSFWIVTPTLNIDIPFYRFFNFRIGAGYQFSFLKSWEVDNGKTLYNAPDNVTSDGPFVNVSIMAGFFSF